MRALPNAALKLVVSIQLFIDGMYCMRALPNAALKHIECGNRNTTLRLHAGIA